MSKNKVIPIGQEFKEQDVELMPSEDYVEPELKVAIVDERMKYCPHDHIQVWKHHRVISCKDCGARIEAFDYVVLLGTKEGNLISERRMLAWQIKHQKEELESLKKQISKLRTQIKKSL